VSTFRLEPEHFILTTGTFNLIVKDRIAFRLSGALSVRTENPLRDPDTSSKPFNRIVSRELLSTLCNHRISTCFAQWGAAIRSEKNSRRTNSLRQRDNALPLEKAGLIRHTPKRKMVKSEKIAGRFCFSRNPSGTLFPNANPETRGQLEAFCIRCRSY